MAVCWQHLVVAVCCIWLCAAFWRGALRSRAALAGLSSRSTHNSPRAGLQLLLLLLV
jgi:hypothetical protein